MRRGDHDTRSWTPLFDEGSGKAKITIEKGEFAIYRLRYWRGESEATIFLFCETADELADRLINEELFAENEAREIASKIIR